jgi:serine/threonine-protein kinase
LTIDHDLELPRPFGAYTLVRRLAVGGMAEVYIAKTQGLGGFEKTVAIKVIHPRYSEDDHFIQMLVEEAKISVLLTHVNIAHTFDLGCIDHTYYIAMEFIEGVDVYRVLRKAKERERAIPLDLAAYIAAEVCNGLDYAHRKRDENGRPLGIVHRDVSPQNVLLSYAGEVKLVDFGIAKAALRKAATEAGVIKGKYYYMSPEQAWGDPMDHRSDIFSVGVVLYELVTGSLLYREENVPALLEKVRKAEIVLPERLRPSVPKSLSQIVMKALEREPAKRFQSAQEMSQALKRFVYGESATFSSTRLTDLLGTLFPSEVQRHSAIISLPLIEVPLETQKSSRVPLGSISTRAPRSRGEENHDGSTRILAPRQKQQQEPGRPIESRSSERLRIEDQTQASPWNDATTVKPNLWVEDESTLVDSHKAHQLMATPSAPSRAPRPVAPPLIPRPSQRVLESSERITNESPQSNALRPPQIPAPVALPPAAKPPPLPASKSTVTASPPRDPFPSSPSMASITEPVDSELSSASGTARRIALWAAAALGMVAIAVVLFRVFDQGPPPGLEIISAPTGARLRIDGREIPGVTPITVSDGIESGRTYRVEVEVPGYHPWAARLSPTSGTLRQFVVLAPMPATLRVETEPNVAEVMVNGVLRGAAPLEITGLVAGQEVEIRAFVHGRPPVIRRVQLREGMTVERISVSP